MTGDRRRILELLAEGALTADAAERLIDALDAAQARRPGPGAAARRPFTCVRIELNADAPEASAARVDLRIPLGLLRAGVRLGALMSEETRDRVNQALRKEGVPFDLGQLAPEHLEALVEALGARPIDIRHTGASVRISCA